MIDTPTPGSSADEARRFAAYRDIANALPGILWEGAGVSHTLNVLSDRVRDVLGLEGDGAEAVDDVVFWRTHLHTEDHEAALRSLQHVLETGVARRIEYRFRVAGGRYHLFEDYVERVRDRAGSEPRLRGLMLDLTAAGDPGAAGAGASADGDRGITLRADDVFGGLAEAVCVVDRQRRITYWNAAAERLTGVPASDALGRASRAVLAHLDADGRRLCGTDRCPTRSPIELGEAADSDAWLERRDGSTPAIVVRSTPTRGAQGQVDGAVQVFSRLGRTPHGTIDGRAGMLSLDALTGLPGRPILEAVLALRQADLERHGVPFGFAWIDLDHAEDIGRAGPAALDDVVRGLGRELQRTIRGGDVVGRWQRGVFGLVAAHAAPTALARLGERLLQVVARARFDGLPAGHRVSISIGISSAAAGQPTEALLQAAGVALATARAYGGDRCVTHTPPDPGGSPQILGPTGQARQAHRARTGLISR